MVWGRKLMKSLLKLWVKSWSKRCQNMTIFQQHTLLQSPMDKHELPLTSSQEIGWFNRFPICINRYFHANWLGVNRYGCILMMRVTIAELTSEWTSPPWRGSWAATCPSTGSWTRMPLPPTWSSGGNTFLVTELPTWINKYQLSSKRNKFLNFILNFIFYNYLEFILWVNLINC